MRQLFIAAFALALALPALAADISFDSSAVRFSTNAKFTHGIAGEAITQGDTLFIDVTDNGRWKKARALTGVSGLYKVQGIAANSAVSGQRVYVCTEDPNFTAQSGAFAAGTVYIQSASSAGKISPAADAASGYWVSFVGVGTSATTMNFKIIRSDVAKP